MRLFGPPPQNEQITTWWQGNIAAATWASRNVSSVSENAQADITITFQRVYRATPAVIISVGLATNDNGYLTALTSSSVRILAANSSGTSTPSRNSGVIVTGLV